MEKLSSYILTKNSELQLAEILDRLKTISDEILIIDSGSTDNTKSIASDYDKVKFVYNEFKNFKDQREFAAHACTHNMILFLDSDEIPDTDFVNSLAALKQEGFKHEAYKVSRIWNVLGKEVHSLYPITSPDYPIRMYNKSKVSFSDSSLVHETPAGYSSVGEISGNIKHITFTSKTEIEQKLELYTNIAAQDLILKKRKVNTFKIIFSPIAAFTKWYFVKEAYKDGSVGFRLASYAYRYTLKKYLKARQILLKEVK